MPSSILELRALDPADHPPPIDDHVLPDGADELPDLANLMAVPGRRGLAARDGEIVMVTPDLAVVPLGIRLGSEARFRYFADQPDRMMLSMDLALHEIDLAAGTAQQLVDHDLFIIGFAPIVGGVAVVTTSPWEEIVLYPRGEQLPYQKAGATQAKHTVDISDIAGGRVLTISRYDEDADRGERHSTVVAAVVDGGVRPIARFGTHLGKVQLHDGRIFAAEGGRHARAWYELLHLEDALAATLATDASAVAELDDDNIPAGVEPAA